MPEPAPDLGLRPRLILASGSPRRLALLRQIGHEPEVLPVDVDETARPGEASDALVERLARAKADAARERLAERAGGAGGAARDDGPDRESRTGRGAGAPLVILGADTVVAHGTRTLGKPADREAFLHGFAALSGTEHRVITAVAALACSPGAELASASGVKVVTRVRFGRVDRDAALRYWASGEPADKAGGYALQGLGARFVESVTGSPSNVVGLPLHEVARLLDAAGVVPSYPPGPDG